MVGYVAIRESMWARRGSARQVIGLGVQYDLTTLSGLPTVSRESLPGATFTSWF